MKCFVDLDGVLADFVRAACQVHRYEIQNRCFKTPEQFIETYPSRVWEMYTAIGIDRNEFYAPMDQEFWATLPKTPEANQILEHILFCYAEKDVFFLTKPAGRAKRAAECYFGKLQWIETHYPQFLDRTIFAIRKEACSFPGTVLIDDSDANITAWRAEGGIGILCPRPWNSGFKRIDSLITDLRDAIQRSYQEAQRIYFGEMGKKESSISTDRPSTAKGLRDSPTDWDPNSIQVDR